MQFRAYQHINQGRSVRLRLSWMAENPANREM